jgi:hypothetical protein
MLKISETYIIGADIDKTISESAVSIVKVDMGKAMHVVKTYYGKEALDFYNKITKKDINK